MQNPRQYKIPDWFLNRQKDIKDGKTGQVSSNGLDNKMREDLERLMREHDRLSGRIEELEQQMRALAKELRYEEAAKLRDRTFHSALGFRDKYQSGTIPALSTATAIDVLSSGTHGRRTRIVFEKVVGEDLGVGIISPDPGTYDPDRWFGHVERLAMEDVGREPVRYVANINKAFLAFSLLLEESATQRAEIERLEREGGR